MTAGAARNLRWPRERFYWGVLDATVLPPGFEPKPEKLAFLFEPLLPRAIEEVHAIYRPLPGRRFLACAIDRAALGEIGPETVTLAPDSLPDFLDEETRKGIDPGLLNLLTGPCKPSSVRRAERRLQLTLAGLAFVTCAFVAVGLERRARSAREAEQHLAMVEADLQRSVLGREALRSPLPLPLQLEAELRALRRTRSDAEGVVLPADASQDLFEVLRRWPAGLTVETDSLHLAEHSLHVQARFTSSGDAQKLADGMRDIPGWRLVQPSLQSIEGGVRATIQLQREERGR